MRILEFPEVCSLGNEFRGAITYGVSLQRTESYYLATQHVIHGSPG